MAVEIYHFDPQPDGPPIISGQVVPEGETYVDPGFGDGSGSDRIVTVCYGRAEILSGEATVEDLSDGRQGIAISAAKHVASLQPGKHCAEELVGPDGQTRQLHIRNIDEENPFPCHLHICRPATDAVEAPTIDYTLSLN